MTNFQITKIAFFVFAFCIDVFAQSYSVDSTIAYIQRLFDNGMYIQSELEARRLLELNNVSDSVKVIAEKNIAFASVAQGKTQSAIEHFLIILSLDSSFELDPVFTSPKIMAAFSDAKRKFIQRKTTLQNSAETQSVVKVPSVTYRAILFPGWEQLHQNREIAGYTFLGAGAGAIASLAYCDIQRRFAKDDYLSATTTADAKSKYSTYNKYYKAEMYSAIAFGIIYVLSEVDAFVNFPHSVSLSLQYNKAAQTAFAGVSLTFH